MSTITWPSAVVPADFEFGLRSNTQVFVSELSGYVQTRELPGARWTVSIRMPPLERANGGADMETFLAKLRGQANRARLPIWRRASPRGTWAGSPVVDNEVGSPTLTQTGASLWLRGFSASATVKAGDYFNLGANGQLLMVVADGTADGGGDLQITFEPVMRASPADATAIVTTNPVLPFAVLSDPHVRWAHNAQDPDGIAVSLEFIEVFE